MHGRSDTTPGSTLLGHGLQVLVEPKTSYHAVSLNGDIDSQVADQLRARLEELVEEGPTGRLVIDLAGSPYLDSAGLGSLVAVYKRCRTRGGEGSAVVLLHPSDEVRELFRLTQLDSYLAMFHTLEEARRAYPWIEG